MRTFDRAFGKEKLALTPESPGIYRFYDEAGALIYVGKAKNLRRRLAQYRNAKRRKKHAKMRKIVAEAVRLEHETCADEFAALRLETEWIQTHRPKWNVAGAFFFLYPMIGIARDGTILRLCYTTMPDVLPGFSFHGAFRSRERTKDAFFALTELLRLLGHVESRPRRSRRIAIAAGPERAPRGSAYVYGFRQIPESFAERLDAFFRGENLSALEELAVLLLERPTAVARRLETQERLRAVRLFWRHEAQALKRARESAGFDAYPVSQRDRDQVFIALKASRAAVPNPDPTPAAAPASTRARCAGARR